MNKLIIIGAGGHGKVVADAAACTNHWKEIVFADKRYPDLLNAGHWPVINDHNDLRKILAITSWRSVIIIFAINYTMN
jgi:prephenate dehydrogenase